MNYAEKLKGVIENDLCTRCGSCVGLGQGKIRFADRTGNLLPVIGENPDEQLGYDLWTACSGQEVDFPAIDRFVFEGKGTHHPYFGTYLDLSIGYASDPAVRRRGGSAGVISATLSWLLDKNLIRGALVLGMSREEPWLPRSFIATTPEEILSTAQSKYLVSPVNETLPELEKFDGTLAYVGLPCQVHSIRKLQMAGHPSVEKIKYIIAPYCGLNLHFSSIISFLRSHGEKNYHDIVDLQFRHGEWPGSMRVEMKNGKVYLLPKFHANYLIPFHIMNRCRVCIDLANEFSDISVGDAWAPQYEERGKGFSIVVTRSGQGKKILEKMVQEGVINLQPVSIQDAVSMHSHMFDNKKRGAFIRIKKRRYPPHYHLDFPANIGFRRLLFEFWLNIMTGLLRTKMMMTLVDVLPATITGKVFNSFKVAWKRITFKVKRDNL
jgi:coenzyme F420 hydrogenase subunit beta